MLEAWKLNSVIYVYIELSSLTEVKDEKRPWILRARESTVHIDSKSNWEMTQSWPRTLIYISCGWESFKEVLLVQLFCWYCESCHRFFFFKFCICSSYLVAFFSEMLSKNTVFNRIARCCCLVRHGIWKRLMLLIFFQAHRGIDFLLVFFSKLFFYKKSFSL